MDSYTVFGLPLHVLLVHAIVVLVPLTSLAVILHALWPAAARRLGIVTPIAGLVVLVLTPITVSAGEALEAKVGVTAEVQKHADLGDTLLPWVIALFVIALIEWLWTRFGSRMLADRLSRPVRITIAVVIAVAAVIIAAGTVIDVVLIGDAGARAVWGGIVGS